MTISSNPRSSQELASFKKLVDSWRINSFDEYPLENEAFKKHIAHFKGQNLNEEQKVLLQKIDEVITERQKEFPAIQKAFEEIVQLYKEITEEKNLSSLSLKSIRSFKQEVLSRAEKTQCVAAKDLFKRIHSSTNWKLYYLLARSSFSVDRVRHLTSSSISRWGVVALVTALSYRYFNESWEMPVLYSPVHGVLTFASLFVYSQVFSWTFMGYGKAVNHFLEPLPSV